MMYNPEVKLQNLSVSPTWAVLESIDKRLRFDFILNPEKVQWNHTANTNELAVLRTSQPLQNFTNSRSTLSLPSVKLWTANNSGSLTRLLSDLKAMTKPNLSGELPVLSLTWGSLKETRVYLTSLEVTEQQWRSGEPTNAECSLSFSLAPEIPKAVYQAVPKDAPLTASAKKTAVAVLKNTSNKDPKKLSPKERSDRANADSVVKAVLNKTDAASKATLVDAYKALNIKAKPPVNKVSKNGKVVTGAKVPSEYDTAKAYWTEYFKGKK